jgi:hypothetical protein
MAVRGPALQPRASPTPPPPQRHTRTTLSYRRAPDLPFAARLLEFHSSAPESCPVLCSAAPSVRRASAQSKPATRGVSLLCARIKVKRRCPPHPSWNTRWRPRRPTSQRTRFYCLLSQAERIPVYSPVTPATHSRCRLRALEAHAVALQHRHRRLLGGGQPGGGLVSPPATQTLTATLVPTPVFCASVSNHFFDRSAGCPS